MSHLVIQTGRVQNILSSNEHATAFPVSLSAAILFEVLTLDRWAWRSRWYGFHCFPNINSNLVCLRLFGKKERRRVNTLKRLSRYCEIFCLYRCKFWRGYFVSSWQNGGEHSAASTDTELVRVHNLQKSLRVVFNHTMYIGLPVGLLLEWMLNRMGKVLKTRRMWV